MNHERYYCEQWQGVTPTARLRCAYVINNASPESVATSASLAALLKPIKKPRKGS